jgi:hypothetical protein
MTPKIDEFVQIQNVKEIDSGKIEINYKLKKEFNNNSGAFSQNLNIVDKNNNKYSIKGHKGNYSLILLGNRKDEIKILFNASRYNEEKTVKF